ncbi:hypothetical protein HDU76_002518 [Blyttiomyces sp. JEL0837]|nr:hypothetical protein HDU76_002518 [Blyttiomyces sp. JEL0837]
MSHQIHSTIPITCNHIIRSAKTSTIAILAVLLSLVFSHANANPITTSRAALNRFNSKSRVGHTIAIYNEKSFCMLLPSIPFQAVGESEGTSVSYCTGGAFTKDSRHFPLDAILSAHYYATPDYVQITGTLNQTRLFLSLDDDGGQYDNAAWGSEPRAECAGHNRFLEIVGGGPEFCIRCCQYQNPTVQDYNHTAPCFAGNDLEGCDNILGNYGPGFSRGGTPIITTSSSPSLPAPETMSPTTSVPLPLPPSTQSTSPNSTATTTITTTVTTTSSILITPAADPVATPIPVTTTTSTTTSLVNVTLSTSTLITTVSTTVVYYNSTTTTFAPTTVYNTTVVSVVKASNTTSSFFGSVRTTTVSPSSSTKLSTASSQTSSLASSGTTSVVTSKVSVMPVITAAVVH